jgi:hypothetical protein
MKAVFTVLALVISTSSAHAELTQVPASEVALYKTVISNAVPEKLHCSNDTVSAAGIKSWVAATDYELWVDKEALQPALIFVSSTPTVQSRLEITTTAGDHKQILKIESLNKEYKKVVVSSDLLNPKEEMVWTETFKVTCQ